MYRPSKEIEKALKREHENKILSKFSPGQYKGAEQVQSVIKASFDFYESILNKYLEKSASIDLLALTLSEYDKYCILSHRYRKGELSPEELKFWEEDGNKSKRAIKYLSEQIVNFLPNKTAPTTNHWDSFYYCLIACEEMTALYMSSEVAQQLEPNDCSLEITEPSNYNFIVQHPNKTSNAVKNIDINSTLSKLDHYIQTKNITIPLNQEYQAKYLDCVFKEAFNMTYTESLQILYELISICKPKSPGISSVWFYPDEMIPALASDRGWPRKQESNISNIISGFSLTPDNLHQRKIFKPKQEHRLLRRAFLNIPNENSRLIIFSKQMALESLTHLISDVCFKKLPTEWLEANKKISKKLDLISNKTGNWFETLLSEEYNSRNIKHIKSLKKITVNGKRKNIPSDVGEIDFLAIVGNKLHIIECKMVQFAPEPRHFLDDISKFTRNEKSYTSKFSKKIDWLNNNLADIKAHMKDSGLNTSNLTTVVPVMVTFYPTIAEAFIEKHSCVSFIQYCDEWL